MVEGNSVIERPMQFRCAIFSTTTTYNSVGVVDPGPSFADAATFTFTPGTTNNVIIGIKWNCTITGAGGGFAGSYGYLRFPPIGEAQRATATNFDSECFSATTADTGGATGDMWIAFEHALAVKANESAGRDTMCWAGKSTYSFVLRQSRRQAGDSISNMNIKIYYLTGSEAKGSITVV